MNTHVKGSTHVDWISIYGIGKIVGVPVYISITTAVKRTSLFAQSDKTLIRLQGFRLLPLVRASWCQMPDHCAKQVAGTIESLYTQGKFFNFHTHYAGLKREPFGIF